jgi:hypothetical protein
MVALGPDSPRPARHTVDRAGGANRETAHSPRELVLVRGFDEQVNVVVLHRELEHPKRRIRSCAKGIAQRLEHRPHA